MEALDAGRRVAVVPFQQSRARAAHGLSLADCEAAAWAVTSGHRRFRGGLALAAVAATLARTGLPVTLYALPGIRPLLDWLYDLVAANRSRLPGDAPYCERHPQHCR